MKKLTVMQPFFFAAYPILFVFANNIKMLFLADLLKLLLIVVTFCAIIFIGLYARLKLINKTALITSTIMLVTLNYGLAFDFIRTTPFNDVLKGKQTPAFIFVIILTLVVSSLILKSKKYLSPMVLLFNIISIIIIVIPLFQIISFYSKYGKVYFSNSDYVSKSKTQNISKDFEDQPDIYYFIIERYGRNDTLKNIYGFNNSEFSDYLKGKGFSIPKKSWANYTQTQLSLASSLNMNYVDQLMKDPKDSGNDHPLINLIEDYKVWHFLKSKGYTFVHSGSWWSGTVFNRYANKNINIPALSEFSELVFNRTIFFPIIIKLQIPLFNHRLNNWIRPFYKFDELAKIPEMKEPTYTFTHFMMTHEPFVFDKDGNYVSEEDINNKDIKQNYREQIIFTNKKFQELINTLLEKSGNIPPIIIIQSDEGPYPEQYEMDSQNYDWSKANEDEVREKMAILNAYYLPHGGDKLLTDFITPVNSFRLIFNYYFDQNFEILPNKSFLSNLGQPFKFITINRDPM